MCEGATAVRGDDSHVVKSGLSAQNPLHPIVLSMTPAAVSRSGAVASTANRSPPADGVLDDAALSVKSAPPRKSANRGGMALGRNSMRRWPDDLAESRATHEFAPGDCGVPVKAGDLTAAIVAARHLTQHARGVGVAVRSLDGVLDDDALDIGKHGLIADRRQI